MSLPQSLPERLILHRGARSQSDVAAAVGITQSAWSNYESGRYVPDSTTIERFAVHVGLTARERGDLLDAVHRAAGERNVERRKARAARGGT